MEAQHDGARMTILVGCSAGAVVGLALYAVSAWFAVSDYRSEDGGYLPPLIGYAGTAVAASGWVLLSACQAGVLMTLAPRRGSARYGAACAALGGLTGLAALAASGWAAYVFYRGDTDAMWTPLAVAPLLLTTSPMLLIAGIHPYVAGRRATP